MDNLQKIKHASCSKLSTANGTFQNRYDIIALYNSQNDFCFAINYSIRFERCDGRTITMQLMYDEY